jgi:mitochondrial fission protein ELM1
MSDSKSSVETAQNPTDTSTAKAAMSGRAEPECVRLDVRPGVTPSGKPPVRIYLGTQPAQFRAERVFVWSIEKVRDPSRVYEIYVMRELAGFDRGRWTTGFTNYRFAIPDFAGRQGRAIWNDVDQIYLADPAGLFDLEMGDHGFLAIAPDGKVDTAVMLLDCARMAEVWSLEDARHGRKKSLINRAMAVPGLHGLLDVEWHARDDKDFDPSRTKLLHYTTLHTQPWWPSPERFVYHDHPLGYLWHDLERSADSAGFQQFTASRPSNAFAVARDAASREAMPAGLESFVGELTAATNAGNVRALDAFDDVSTARADGVVCVSGLESVPEDDVPWLLDEMFRAAERFVLVSLDCSRLRASRPADAFASCLYSDPIRWPAYLAMASRRKASIHWELVLRDLDAEGRASLTRHWGGPFLGASVPRVWVVEGDGGPDREAALALAAELGWPYEIRSAYDPKPLPSEGPDLLIAAGESARAAVEEIRRDSAGRTRAVLVSDEASPRVEDLDLVVTTVAAGSFPDPRLLETIVPLARIDEKDLLSAVAAEGEKLEPLGTPRLAVIVDGPSRRGVSAELGAKLASDARRLADERSASLVFVVAPEVPGDALAAIASAVRPAALVLRASARVHDSAYLACLALCDAFVVLGDDEHTIADVGTTGRPVTIYPHDGGVRGVTESVRRVVHALAVAPRKNDRGTTRPQQGLELFASSLISRGYIRPPRDYARMQAELVARGAAQMFGVAAAQGVPAPLREVARVAARVRTLVGLEKGVRPL